MLVLKSISWFNLNFKKAFYKFGSGLERIYIFQLLLY